MEKCKVLTCDPVKKPKGLCFFTFPEPGEDDPDRRLQWIKFTKQKEFEPTEEDRICSLHFEKKYLSEIDGKMVLKDGAIPTIRKTKTKSTANKTENVRENTLFCRFCFKNSPQYSTLKETAELLEMELNDLFKMFDLSNDHYDILPKSVCSSCFQEIQICYDFKLTVQKAEKEMISYFTMDTRSSSQLIVSEYAESQNEEVELIQVKVENTVEDYVIEEISQESEVDVKMEQQGEPSPKKEQPQQEDQEHFFDGMTESDSSDDSDCGMIANPKKYVLKTYKCPVCNLKFGGKKTFESHECDVDDPNPTKCKICGKQLKDIRGLRAHINRAHSKNSSTVKKRKCPMCKKIFVGIKSRFTKHRAKECPKRGEPIQCEICFKTCRTLSGFTTHMLHHTSNSLKNPQVDPNLSAQAKNNLCDHCGFICDSPVEFSKHVEKNHKEFFEVSCPDCPKKFQNQMRWYGHWYAVHKKDEKVCDICSKVCKNKFNLSDHMKIHRKRNPEEEGKYKCLICEKKFYRSDHLKVHMNSHTKEKMWECECGKTYTTKHQLKQHKSKVHNETL